MNDERKGIGARFRNLIDVRAGAFSAILMGLIVWAINMAATSPPDMFGSTTAAVKQAAYTFFASGFILRASTWLALRPGKYPALTIANAAFLPGAAGSLATYFVHSLRGTPSPLLSTMPTFFTAIVILPFWAIHQRRKA